MPVLLARMPVTVLAVHVTIITTGHAMVSMAVQMPAARRMLARVRRRHHPPAFIMEAPYRP
jgi:hypothetical protein